MVPACMTHAVQVSIPRAVAITHTTETTCTVSPWYIRTLSFYIYLLGLVLPLPLDKN